MTRADNAERSRHDNVEPAAVPRDTAILELRAGGRSFKIIAQVLGYPTAHSARDAYFRAARGLPGPDRELLRDAEISRLNRLEKHVWAKAEIAPDKRERLLAGIRRMRQQIEEL